MNLYPYTDFHELNDDWIIGHIKKDEKDIAALQNTIVNLNFEFDRKADKATTYTKTEVDNLLVAKADKTTTYTKTEVDNLLVNKANKATTLAGYGITDAYTKNEVNTSLANKADKATTLAGYGITDAYTKTEVNTSLANKANKTDTYTKSQIDFITSQITNRLNLVTVQTLTFTETTNALGAFYIGNLTAANSIILEVYSTEYYTYLFRLGNNDRWVAYCLNDNINPVGNTEIHVTVKYFDIS